MDSPQTIVIVGGVAGGASAATCARRMNEHARIILLEKDEHVSFANCGLPYYIGGEIDDRGKLLVATPELLFHHFRLDVRIRHEVLQIDREGKCVTVMDHGGERQYQQNYDKLILAPGAAPIVPPIEGVDAAHVFTLRNVADTDAIVAAARQSKTQKAIVVGAGYIGIEMVEQLIRRGFEVALAELQSQILPGFDAEMVQPLQVELASRGASLHLGDGIQRILTDERGVASGVELQSGKQLAGDLVILGIGVRPNTALAQQAGLEIGAGHGVRTNRFLQTSDPDIYAVGDVVEYTFGPTGDSMRIALAGPANRAGRLAGEHAATGRCAPMADVFGTAIVRAFSQVAAMTGLSVKSAERTGIPCRSVTVIMSQHAGYYPGAKPVVLKLVYEPETGKVLGAQAVGQDGIDKRIDVIATAMAMKATVRDLAGLDLTYAPPFGSAKDVVHIAAFAACNQLDGVDDFINSGVDLSGFQVVDVRTSPEVGKGPLPGADNVINIPLHELRERLGELDKTADTVVTCGMGLRAHVGVCILRQHDFQWVKNLSGGAIVRKMALEQAKRGE